MVKKYAYVMIPEGCCSFCEDNSVYTSDKEIPFFDLIILMIRNNAYICELYETNFTDDLSEWKLKSKFEGVTGDGIFSSLKS